MKGKIAILALVALLCFPTLSRSQAVVIDPSQIAASAVNAADQLDYMFDQLGELAHLGEQMNTMRDHINNVFGEDGIGAFADGINIRLPAGRVGGKAGFCEDFDLLVFDGGKHDGGFGTADIHSEVIGHDVRLPLYSAKKCASTAAHSIW